MPGSPLARVASLPKPVKIALWVALALLAYALPLLEPPIISTPGVDFGGVLVGKQVKIDIEAEAIQRAMPRRRSAASPAGARRTRERRAMAGRPGPGKIGGGAPALHPSRRMGLDVFSRQIGTALNGGVGRAPGWRRGRASAP